MRLKGNHGVPSAQQFTHKVPGWFPVLKQSPTPRQGILLHHYQYINSATPTLSQNQIKSNQTHNHFKGIHPCLQFPSYHLHGNFCVFIMMPLIQILILNGLRDKLPLWTVEVLILFQCTVNPSSSIHHSQRSPFIHHLLSIILHGVLPGVSLFRTFIKFPSIVWLIKFYSSV